MEQQVVLLSMCSVTLERKYRCQASHTGLVMEFDCKGPLKVIRFNLLHKASTPFRLDQVIQIITGHFKHF